MATADSLALQHPPESGRVVARHYRSGEAYRISWDEAGILQEMEVTKEATGDLWFAPGLTDLQVNGYAGIDFQNAEGITESQLLHVSRTLRQDGCRRILLTLITAPWQQMLSGIRHLRHLINGHAELRQTFVGWHIEGPFLSNQPGYSGAHPHELMLAPLSSHIEELAEITAGDIVLLTLAPECEGAGTAIKLAIGHGFQVSLGHSNASANQLKSAVSAGANAFTHLGNGCPQLLDRHDNILWRVLDTPALTIGLIPDGIHVSPQLFRILHALRRSGGIYWTTDAMSAAAAPPGYYSLGQSRLWVGEDLVVRNPDTQSFAGSALTPIEGVRRGAAMLGYSWREVWDYFSVHPARLVGLPSDLAVGSPAGFCLLRSTD